MSRTVAITALLTLVVGCSHQNEPNVPRKTGGGGTPPYLTTDRLLWAEYGTWDDQMVFLMWVDLVGERGRSGSGGRGSSSSPTGVRYQGSSRNAKGLDVEWQCDTSDGVTGSMKVNGAGYDLAKGRVFLVTVRADGTQVRQLERDLSKVKVEDTTAFSKTDAEIAKFITVEKK